MGRGDGDGDALRGSLVRRRPVGAGPPIHPRAGHGRARDAARTEVGGRVGVSVWRGIAENPYFTAQVNAVTQRLGEDAGSALAAGFQFSDPAPLVDALAGAGLEDVEIERLDLLLNLPPLADWAPRHLAATPVASALGTAPGIARELGADVALRWPTS